METLLFSLDDDTLYARTEMIKSKSGYKMYWAELWLGENTFHYGCNIFDECEHYLGTTFGKENQNKYYRELNKTLKGDK